MGVLPDEVMESDTILDSLVEKPLDNMSDDELDDYIKQIRHTGIERQARKSERSTKVTVKKQRENKMVRDLRARLEADGKSSAQIEEAVTRMKVALGET